MSKKLWKPNLIDKFIADYMSGMSQSDLSVNHSGTIDQVKGFISYLRKHEDLPSAKEVKEGLVESYEYKGTKIREDFVSFLLKSKTIEEIEDKFGEDTQDLLRDKYDNLELYSNINNYNKKTYILLPKIKEKIVVKDKSWKHVGSIKNGIKQPYQLINLPDNAFDYDGEIIIAPIADAHIGHFGHKREKLLSYLRWIEETPNVYSMIVGDLQENALDDGRGMTYSQAINPESQIEECCHLLAPVAHKIFSIQPGNHEDRTYKKAGIDPAKFIADKLEIPYFAGPVYQSIVWRDFKWKIYSFHGNTNSQTKGGKLNAAGRARRWTDFVNFYVSAHVHDPNCNPETCIVEDVNNNGLNYKTEWTVICPSFMRWEETYAYTSNFPPPGKGGVALYLYSNGDYTASLRDRSN